MERPIGRESKRLGKSIIVTDTCWEKVKEISVKEKFHMYEVVEAIIDQYYYQVTNADTKSN